MEIGGAVASLRLSRDRRGLRVWPLRAPALHWRWGRCVRCGRRLHGGRWCSGCSGWKWRHHPGGGRRREIRCIQRRRHRDRRAVCAVAKHRRHGLRDLRVRIAPAPVREAWVDRRRRRHGADLHRGFRDEQRDATLGLERPSHRGHGSWRRHGHCLGGGRWLRRGHCLRHGELTRRHPRLDRRRTGERSHRRRGRALVDRDHSLRPLMRLRRDVRYRGARRWRRARRSGAMRRRPLGRSGRSAFRCRLLLTFFGRLLAEETREQAHRSRAPRGAPQFRWPAPMLRILP